MERTADIELNADILKQVIEDGKPPDFDGEDPMMDEVVDVLAAVYELSKTRDVWLLVRKREVQP
jgi:hypothetical protein